MLSLYAAAPLDHGQPIHTVYNLVQQFCTNFEGIENAGHNKGSPSTLAMDSPITANSEGIIGGAGEPHTAWLRVALASFAIVAMCRVGML